jgi:CheY-like chemotaxis protein
VRTVQKILVVEDERNLRLLYTMDLESEGYVVVTAAEGVEGLRLFDSESPDLVVLDIRMPGMDGLDAMGRMLRRNARVPVVLNSGYPAYEASFLSWAAHGGDGPAGAARELAGRQESEGFSDAA